MNSILALFINNTDHDGGTTVIDRPVVSAPPPKLDVADAPATAKPPMYAVLLHNDDSTNPAFVVQVLVDVFGKNESAAYQVMLAAHTSGKAVVVICSKDMAETRVEQAMNMVVANGAGQNVRDHGAPCALTFTAEKNGR
jgi:ATP-dependent Clp protease adaptor protein ClpS